MKVALFHNTQFDYLSPWERAPSTEGWVQTSGWVEVEFPPLTEEEKRVAEELVALGKRQAAIEADFRRQRHALEDERAALLRTGT